MCKLYTLDMRAVYTCDKKWEVTGDFEVSMTGKCNSFKRKDETVPGTTIPLETDMGSLPY